MPSRALPIALLLVAAPLCATDYVQAPGSSLAFAGSYQGEVFTGRFPGFATRLSFDPAQLATSRLDVVIPLASATTGNEDYDPEMRGKWIADVAESRDRGYAVDVDGLEAGLTNVAVIVPGGLSLAVGLSGPSARLTARRTARLVPRLRKAARSLVILIE